MNIYNICYHRFAFLSFFFVLLFAGCNGYKPIAPVNQSKTVDHPMHASLDWLTAEKGPVQKVNDINGRWLLNLIFIPPRLVGFDYDTPQTWEQRTILSVGGGLQMPLVGDAYYWEQNSSPVTAIRIFEPPKYRWYEGIIEPPSTNTFIIEGKKALEDFQALTSQILDLILEESQMKARLDIIKTNQSSKQETIFISTTNASIILTNLNNIQCQLQILHTNIEKTRTSISSNLNRGGIIVFRWDKCIENNKNILFNNNSFLNKQRNKETGFAILSGVKIKSLRPDFIWSDYYHEIERKRGYRDFSHVGVVTYLLQAHDIVYVRDVALLNSLSIDVDISKLIKDVYGENISLQTLDKLKLILSIYRATISQLATYGAMTDIHWKDYQCDETAKEQTMRRSGELTNSWTTVYAVLTHPKGLTHEKPNTGPFIINWMGKRFSSSKIEDKYQNLQELEFRTTNTIRFLKEMKTNSNTHVYYTNLYRIINNNNTNDYKAFYLYSNNKNMNIFTLLNQTAQDWGADFKEFQDLFEDINNKLSNNVDSLKPFADYYINLLFTLINKLHELDYRLHDAKPLHYF